MMEAVSSMLEEDFIALESLFVSFKYFYFSELVLVVTLITYEVINCSCGCFGYADSFHFYVSS